MDLFLAAAFGIIVGWLSATIVLIAKREASRGTAEAGAICLAIAGMLVLAHVL